MHTYTSIYGTQEYYNKRLLLDNSFMDQCSISRNASMKNEIILTSQNIVWTPYATTLIYNVNFS